MSFEFDKDFYYSKDLYYDGPPKNKYKDWTEEEMEEDIRKAEEKAKKYKSWDEVDC